jgi:hypothetical protein
MWRMIRRSVTRFTERCDLEQERTIAHSDCAIWLQGLPMRARSRANARCKN